MQSKITFYKYEKSFNPGKSFTNLRKFGFMYKAMLHATFRFTGLKQQAVSWEILILEDL
jgi:hypothetical protein